MLSSRFRRFLPLSGLFLALALSGCIGTSALDELDQSRPMGSPFSQALYKDYAYLARSFGDVGPAKNGAAFDSDESMTISDVTADVADLANAYAEKALAAARGDEVVPEAPPTDMTDAETLRLRLLTDLDAGRDKAPIDGARAQVDFDCWIMNGRVHSQKRASEQCRRSLDASLARLERDLGTAEPPPPAPTAAAAPGASYTVYFDWDSWTLSAQALTTLQSAIDAARGGRQTTITIVGHTDTSGSSAYNQGLSLRRANVVKDVLVQMGARPEAIQASGVGESDLAVQTGDGVREPKNRRSVVTLVP
jgi:outer membrane protein OmpA-like peptidoglycan-associated protein